MSEGNIVKVGDFFGKDLVQFVGLIFWFLGCFVNDCVVKIMWTFIECFFWCGDWFDFVCFDLNCFCFF